MAGLVANDRLVLRGIGPLEPAIEHARVHTGALARVQEVLLLGEVEEHVAYLFGLEEALHERPGRVSVDLLG